MPTWPNRPVEWYIEALNDADVRVRRQAVAALEALGDPRVVGPLLQTLGADVDPDLRGRAAAALAKLGDRQAVGPLIAALHDPDAEVRSSAVVALKPFAERRAVEASAGGLDDTDWRVRDQAALGFASRGGVPGIWPRMEQFRVDEGDLGAEPA